MKALRKLALLSAGALSLMSMTAALPAAFSVSAEEKAETGTWDFDEATGTLTVSGEWNDASASYSMRTFPWTKLQHAATPVLSVVFAEGMTRIPQAALIDFDRVTSVSVPDSVESIGAYAFGYCSALKQISLPDSVKIIGDYAFSGCSALKEISLPETMTEIGGCAFQDTCWLDDRRAENPLVSVCGFLIDGVTCEGAVQIPDGITEICAHAFHCNEKITEIHFADSVKKIGENAFSVCDALERAEIPQSVTVLSDFAFLDCGSLRSVIMEKGVTEIGTHAFAECRNLTEIVIPETVNKIAEEAFAGTPWLVAQQRKNPLVIVNNVLVDGSTCTGETVIPEGVTEILPAAFLMSRVTSLTVPEGVTVIPRSMCSFCTELSAVTLPKTAVSIGDDAFKECRNLKEITVPPSVRSIGDDAFMTADVTVIGYVGSAAEEYASKNRMNFVAIGRPDQVRLCGDANSDGTFDIADAVLAARFIVADTGAVMTDAGRSNADVTGDGEILPDDVTAMLQHIARKILVFPAEEKNKS